jgi:hypothetical protein
VRWENDEEENDALDKIPSSLIDERIFHTFFSYIQHINSLFCLWCKGFDVKHATILRHVCTHRSQRSPMDKKAFEREAKQRMTFQLCALQEFWRNLGLKNIPSGTLSGTLSQTKAELKADWLSVTPQSVETLRI